jgi:hypothetical protein
MKLLSASMKREEKKLNFFSHFRNYAVYSFSVEEKARDGWGQRTAGRPIRIGFFTQKKHTLEHDLGPTRECSGLFTQNFVSLPLLLLCLSRLVVPHATDHPTIEKTAPSCRNKNKSKCIIFYFPINKRISIVLVSYCMSECRS